MRRYFERAVVADYASARYLNWDVPADRRGDRTCGALACRAGGVTLVPTAPAAAIAHLAQPTALTYDVDTSVITKESG